MVEAKFAKARIQFHAALLAAVLHVNDEGVPTNSDKSSKPSVAIGQGILDRLKSEASRERLPGQTAGNEFETVCEGFIKETFLRLQHLRPGKWEVRRAGNRNRLAIAEFEQYAHLIALDRAAKKDRELAAALGSDYTITPDIIVIRGLEADADINAPERLVNADVTKQASLREVAGGLPLLHASISCKWTIRSDRAQNARSEALNLVRNRKGRLPHVVVVTGEPLPSRIASIALGLIPRRLRREAVR